eukprot:g6104.t1
MQERLYVEVEKSLDRTGTKQLHVNEEVDLHAAGNKTSNSRHQSSRAAGDDWRDEQARRLLKKREQQKQRYHLQHLGNLLTLKELAREKRKKLARTYSAPSVVRLLVGLLCAACRSVVHRSIEALFRGGFGSYPPGPDLEDRGDHYRSLPTKVREGRVSPAEKRALRMNRELHEDPEIGGICRKLETCLYGETLLITGGTSGIGFAALQEIVERRPKRILLLVRDEADAVPPVVYGPAQGKVVAIDDLERRFSNMRFAERKKELNELRRYDNDRYNREFFDDAWFEDGGVEKISSTRGEKKGGAGGDRERDHGPVPHQEEQEALFRILINKRARLELGIIVDFVVADLSLPREVVHAADAIVEHLMEKMPPDGTWQPPGDVETGAGATAPPLASRRAEVDMEVDEEGDDRTGETSGISHGDYPCLTKEDRLERHFAANFLGPVLLLETMMASWRAKVTRAVPLAFVLEASGHSDYAAALRDIEVWNVIEGGFRPPGGALESGWQPTAIEAAAAVERLLARPDDEHEESGSLFVEDAPLGSGLRPRVLPISGGPDEVEDLALVQVSMPDELGVDRYEDSSMDVRANGAGASMAVARPNLVQTAVPQRGVTVAPPLSATKPPSLMAPDALEKLKADAKLEPTSRVGVLPRQLLTLEEAMDAIAASLEPVLPEKHQPSSEHANGFESDSDSETDDQNFQLAQKGQFVPAAGGKQSLNTMLTYKTQYRRLCEPLMKKCKLSRRRCNVSQTSLDILYRTLRVCGDFPQSRHLYFSQVKGHTEMTHAFRPEVQKTYDNYFGRLLSMRKRGHQQKGFRASDMVHMANTLGGSRKLREEVVMLFDHEGTTVKVTAELAFRFMVACWWAFLRPDCAGHSGRRILEGGNGAVQYTTHSSKTDQSGEIAAETVLECNCRSLPKAAICLCPVHCISTDDFEGMQRTLKLHAANRKKKVAEKLKPKDAQADDILDEDRDLDSSERPAEPKWAAAIHRILELVGIDNPRLAAVAAGSVALQDRIRPLLEREARAQERSDLLGSGQISEEDRKNLRKVLADLSFKCKPSQFLALKKAAELLDITQGPNLTTSPTHPTTFTNFSFDDNMSRSRSSSSSSAGEPGVDFAAEILKDKAKRVYGAGPLLPAWIRSAIDFQKTSSEEDTFLKSKRMAKQLVRLRHRFLQQETQDHNAFPPHLEKLYVGKNFRFLHELASEALSEYPELARRREDVLSIIQKMKEGLISSGEIRPRGFWEPRRQEEADQQLREAQAARSKASRGPPAEHWCSESDIIDMWKQTQKHIAAGRWSIVGHSNGRSVQLGGPHPITFPVHQGGKIRMCVDFRKKSEQVTSREKMRLLGVRSTVEALCRLMSEKAEQASLFQFKDDVKAQVEEEKLDREQLRSLATKRRVEMIAADVRNMEASWAVSQQPAVAATAEGVEYAFVPASAKRDLSGYYYQFGVRDPKDNRLWVPVPRTVEGGPRRVWALIESTCSLFGALVSVYDCVHASELIMLVIAGRLRLCASLYIDDVHLMSRQATLQTDQELLDLFLRLSGFKQSEEKMEAHSATQRSLTVLGMAYDLGRDGKSLTIRIPQEKVLKLHNMGAELLSSIRKRDIDHRKLLSFRGLFRHVAQINTQLSGVVRGLDKWADEEWFASAVKSKHQRAALKRLVATLLYCQKLQQARVLSPVLFERPFAHVYSDASLERLQELKKKLKAGVRSGLHSRDVWAGAILLLPDGRKKFSKLQVTAVPKFINYLRIGVLELLAVRLAVLAWGPELSKHYSIFHQDNLGSVFITCRNSCTCAVSQNLASSLTSAVLRLDMLTWGKLSRRESSSPVRASVTDTAMSMSQEGEKKESLLAATHNEMNRRIRSDVAGEKFTASAQETIAEMLKMGSGEVVPFADQDQELRNLVKYGLECGIPILTQVPLGPTAGDQHSFMLNKGTRPEPQSADPFFFECEKTEIVFKGVLMGETAGKATPIFVPSDWQTKNVQQAWYTLRDYAEREDKNSHVARDKLLSAIKVMYSYIHAYSKAISDEPWEDPFKFIDQWGLHLRHAPTKLKTLVVTGSFTAFDLAKGRVRMNDLQFQHNSPHYLGVANSLAYGHSKLLLHAYFKTFAEKHPEWQVFVADPGVVNTKLHTVLQSGLAGEGPVMSAGGEDRGGATTGGREDVEEAVPGTGKRKDCDIKQPNIKLTDVGTTDEELSSSYTGGSSRIASLGSAYSSGGDVCGADLGVAAGGGDGDDQELMAGQEYSGSLPLLRGFLAKATFPAAAGKKINGGNNPFAGSLHHNHFAPVCRYIDWGKFGPPLKTAPMLRMDCFPGSTVPLLSDPPFSEDMKENCAVCDALHEKVGKFVQTLVDKYGQNGYGYIWS